MSRPSGSSRLSQAGRSPRVWWTTDRLGPTVCWEGMALLRVREGRSVELDVSDLSSHALDEILNPALALVLAHRGCQILHAGAVAAGGACAVILGPPGAGKSSLVLAAAWRGLGVVSDEIVPLREGANGFDCPGGNPLIRIDGDAGGRPGRVKRKLDMRRTRLPVATGPSRIEALVFLADRLEPSDRRACRIEQVPPRRALLGLMENTYNRRVLTDEERRRHLRDCARAAEAIPAYSLWVREGLSNIGTAARVLEGLLPRSCRRSR